MSYLEPPPAPSPVVVVKDVGGYVNEYASRTELYRATNREVRLHECRSACTMALSLPNVCVYPDSVLKFHQAYDPRDHSVNLGVSQQLFQTYPPAVRARLGTLTRQYQVLRGSELISLGVRDCNVPQGPRIMVATATPKPLPDSMTSSGSGFSVLTGKLQGMVSALTNRPGQPAAPQPPVVETKPQTQGEKPVPEEFLRGQVPLPPQRDNELTKLEPAKSAPDKTGPATTPSEQGKQPELEPLPPQRPLVLAAYTPMLKPIPLARTIPGAAPILPAHFIPYGKI